MNHLVRLFLSFFYVFLIIHSLTAKSHSFDESLAYSANQGKEVLQSGNFSEWADFLNRQMITFTHDQNIPNAVIALVSADEIHLLQGYGYANMENKIPVDPAQHLFRTGSVSKIFTWTAIMQLYERGLLDLDTDINHYIDLDLNHMILYPTNIEEPITISHLMTHTAGFEDVLEGLFSFSPQPTLQEYLKRYQPARLYPPGKVMAYSNYGTTLAGYIVEKVSGMEFSQYIDTYIFSPLGMQKSSFLQPLPVDLEKQMVTVYRWVDHQFLPGRFEYLPLPAGGLSTTAKDMALFMQAQLNNGSNAFGQILNPETLHIMHSPLKTYHPLVAGMAHGFMTGTINNLRVIQHSGSSSVFDAGFYMLPELGVGIFIAYSGGDYMGHIKLFRHFMETFFQPDSNLISNPSNPLAKPTLSDLNGQYHQSRSIQKGNNKIMNLLMGSMNLKSSTDGEISFSLYGQDFSFDEVTPGIYLTNHTNNGYPFGPVQYLLASASPDGRLMLIIDGPMTYIKARWYETSQMALLIFIPALILALGFLLAMPIRILYRKLYRIHTKSATPDIYLKTTLAAHALSLVLLLVIFAANSAPHPVHLLPESFFDPDPLIEMVLSIIPFIVSALAFLVPGIYIVALKRKSVKSIFSGLFYSLYAIWALGLVWLFWFYNLLI